MILYILLEHHISKSSRYFSSAFRSVQVSAPLKLIYIAAHHCTAVSSRRLDCPATKGRKICFYLEYTHFEGVLYHSANMLGPDVNWLQNKSAFRTGQHSFNALHLHMGSRVSLYQVTRIKEEISKELVMSRQIWPCVWHRHIWGSGGIILLIRNVGSRWDVWWHSSPGRFTPGRGGGTSPSSNQTVRPLSWSDCFKEAINILSLPRIWPGFLSCEASSLVTTTTRYSGS